LGDSTFLFVTSLERNQDGDQSLAASQRTERLADNRSESLNRVHCFHRVAWGRRCGEQIANFDRLAARVDFAVHLPEQRYRFATLNRLTPVEHNARLELAAAGDHPGDSFVVSLIAWSQSTIGADYHDGPGFDAF
jgi:hypothetical protein